MSFFERRRQTIASGAGTYGQTTKIELTREHYLDGLFVNVHATDTGVAAWAGGKEGLMGILKTVRLTVNDGSKNRTVVVASGASLLELERQLGGRWDPQTCHSAQLTYTGAATSGTGQFDINYQLMFRPPNLADPIASFFMLPLPRYNTNPILELEWDQSANIFSANAPTFTYEVTATKRFVDRVDFVTWDTEIMQQDVTFSAAGSRQEIVLPASLGGYFGVLLEAMTTANVRDWQHIGGSATHVFEANNLFELAYIDSTYEKLRFNVLRAINQRSISNQYDHSSVANLVKHGCVPYSYYLDFVNDQQGQSSDDMNSLLNTTPIVGQGARLRLLVDLSSAGKLRMTTFRVYGDLTKLRRG